MRNTSNVWSSVLMTAVSTLLGTHVDAAQTNTSVKSEQEKKMNVLFIAIDDFKPIVGCYGNEIIQTPNIDKLAGQGTLFTHAYCQQAVSGPSRASLMTGWTPDHTKVWDLKTPIRSMNADVITLPQTFRGAGYTTAAVGKIYDPRSVDKGHDKASWSIPYMDNTPYFDKNHELPVCMAYQDPKVREQYAQFEQEGMAKGLTKRKLAKYVTDHVKRSTECMDVPNNAYFDGATALTAIDFIDKQDGDSPFFLAVGFKKPHLPFVAPKKYWDLYSREDIPLAKYRKRAADTPDYVYHKSSELTHYTDIPSIYSYNDVDNTVLPDWKQRELIHGYYACISYTDALIGSVLDALDKKGLRDNTIVVLWGDHGWHLGDHGLWNKHTNFEQATHVPMMISVPDAPVQVIDSPVQLMDIYPTLLDLCQVDACQKLDGHIISPILAGKTSSKKVPYAVSQYHRVGKMGYSFRTAQYRYTVWTSWKNKQHDWDTIFDVELYDYKQDPLEKKNRANQKEYKKVRKMMHQYWLNYKKEILQK